MTASREEIPEPAEDEETLDPRVQIELEILNQCSSDVNRLEREVDEARSKYQQNFTSCSQQLERLKKNLSRSIKKARPYYELKERAREAQSEALRSARKFQSANGVYLAAKETISLAELRLMDDKAASLSAAWQEMLNHALMRVTEAEKAKSASEKEHLDRAATFAQIEQQMCILEKTQKRSIAKARQYFEKKKELELKLQQVKQSIQDLQQAMVAAKARYSGALRRLETISDCIHEQRRQQFVLMYPREPGVGAEENEWNEQKLPSLSTYDVDGCEDYDDTYECDDVDDDDCDGIDSESVFRTRVLTTSLDDEDTSFVKGSKLRGQKKQLKRSQSLPVNASQLARRSNRGREVLTPLADREETCPPDGESVGSGASVGACSVSSVSSQAEIESLVSNQGEISITEEQHGSHSQNTSDDYTKSSEVPVNDLIICECDSSVVSSQSYNSQASDFTIGECEHHEQLDTPTPPSHSSQFCSQVSDTAASHSESSEPFTFSLQSSEADCLTSSVATVSLDTPNCPELSSDIPNSSATESPSSSSQVSEVDN
ncbi:SH3 domain-binding protein 5-like protein [Elysia marginata]|uniref:SH3 domain-binding protein 5-like protein n=1 Tax=Elysia marginata TaxID=1093978 RepID=A0AAV4J223_9GAST|nr:SH3 domain-binding protein 5-like protein [Elysia marginata]